MQFNNMTRWLQQFASYPWAWMLRKLLLPLYDRQSSVFLSPASGAGLVISGAGATTAKVGGTNLLVLANGIFVSIAAATVLPVLAGTIPQNTFGGWCFFVDQGGALSSLFMNPSTANSITTMGFPQFPMGKTFLGFVYLNPTTAPFIGGTTLLDAANTNAVYVSPSEGFDPYCLIGGVLGSE